MSRFLKIAGVLLVLAVLIYVLIIGLGLTRGFQKHRNAKKILVLNDFEYPDDDLDWQTGGYVKIESSTENQTHGKLSAKATYLLSSEFFSQPTPEATWMPSMVLSTDSVTKIPLDDWTGYTTLNVDAFNPQDQPITYTLEVADGRAFQYSTSGALTPKKVTNVSVPLDALIGARLDLSAIRSISLSVDTQGNTEPVQVYWDYLRLEEDLQNAPSKK
jgi:hypothetical protein